MNKKDSGSFIFGLLCCLVFLGWSIFNIFTTSSLYDLLWIPLSLVITFIYIIVVGIVALVSKDRKCVK